MKNLDMTYHQIQALIKDLRDDRSLTPQDVACDWIKNHQSQVNDWLVLARMYGGAGMTVPKPQYVVFPIILTVIFVAVSSFVFVSNPIIEEDMRLIFTLQGLQILQCSIPILFMSWFVSSLLEAAFND